MIQMNQVRFALLGRIFWTFFKISPVTFGGGYAMIPAIEREIVQHNKWLTEHEITDALAIAGTAPGAIGLNAATFIGYRLLGLAGALSAILGMILPTFFIVVLLAITYLHYQNNSTIVDCLKGIRPAIVALILVAGYKTGSTSIFDKYTLAVAVFTILLLLFTPIHPVLLILLGVAASVLAVKIKQLLHLPVVTEKQLKTTEENGNGFYKYPDYFIGDGI